MRLRSVKWVGAGLLIGLLGLGCSNPEHFTEPTKQSQRVVDITNVVMNGRAGQPADPAFVFPVTVLGDADMAHPHFEGHWTIADPEKVIDVYVIPAVEYDPTKPPPLQPSVFWSSIIEGVFITHATDMHLHPTPGDWVIVFYNPALPGLQTRSTISAEINLTFFR